MFRPILLVILEHVWKFLLIGTFLFAFIRYLYFKKSRKKLVFYKEVLLYLCFIYFVCLFYVVTFEDVIWSTSNYIPFKEITRYPVGSYAFMKNVIGNIIMFVPLGFFIGYYTKIKKKKWVFLIVLAVSFFIEIMQDYLGRVFDIDDILLNVFGGLLGYLVCMSFKNIKSNLPSLLKKNAVYNIIVVVLLILFICYLGNIIKVGVL